MNANAAFRLRASLILGCLLAGLGGCSKPDVSVSIPFAAYFGQEPIACGQDAGPVQLTDLRLYVSEVKVVREGNQSVPASLQSVSLAADSQWQQENLALLDLENADGSCENGTRNVHDTLHGSLPAGDYRGLVFSIGVPFDRNHGDPLLAEAPLGDSAMHWSWRGGYKFLRAGVRTETDGFWIHLGSTGCEGTIQNISGCNAPNRVTVMLPDFEPGKHEVAIDLKALLAGIDLDDAEPGDCSSGPAEQNCDAVFAALGLEFGARTTTAEQRVFASRTRN